LKDRLLLLVAFFPFPHQSNQIISINMEADEAVRRQHKANAAAMAGLSLDSRVGNRLAPRGGGAGTDHKLGKSLPRKSHENADEGEEWEEAVNDDDDYDEEVEETKQVEAASRIFYKSKSVAELLGVPVKPKAASSSTSSSSSSSSDSSSSSSSSSSAGNVTLSTLSQSSQDSIDTLKVPTATDHAHEERLNELVKRRQEMVRLEAKLKGLEEALTTERTELRRLESQLPPAASRFTTHIATKSSTALLQLRDEQLAAKAAKEQRKKARAEKKKAKEAKRKASAGGSDSFIAATDNTTTDTSGDDTKVGAVLVGDLLRSGGR
jgi:hypothetical protein